MLTGLPKFGVERLNMISCLFCEKPGNLVFEPDEEAYYAIKNVADERRDAIRDKFYLLYDGSLARQCFSWHLKCATSYVCFDDTSHSERPQIVPKQEIKQEEPEEKVQVKIEETPVIKEVPYSERRGVSTKEIIRCLICDQKLNLLHVTPHSIGSKLSAAKLIYETAHRRYDSVFKKIRKYQSPDDMIDKGMHYHKACYLEYVKQNKCCPKKRPGKISHKDMFKGLKKLLNEIDEKLTTCCFQLSFLAKRLAKLTEVKDAVVELETVKSLLTANYGERLLFSYPAGLGSCVVFLSSVPLNEAMKRLR